MLSPSCHATKSMQRGKAMCATGRGTPMEGGGAGQQTAHTPWHTTAIEEVGILACRHTAHTAFPGIAPSGIEVWRSGLQQRGLRRNACHPKAKVTGLPVSPCRGFGPAGLLFEARIIEATAQALPHLGSQAPISSCKAHCMWMVCQTGSASRCSTANPLHCQNASAPGKNGWVCKYSSCTPWA